MRQCLLLVLVGTAVALTPLAHGTPPDPTWIGGFYDDADLDEAVQVLTAASAAVDGRGAAEPGLRALSRLGPSDEPGHSPAARRSSHPPRAPPLG